MNTPSCQGHPGTALLQHALTVDGSNDTKGAERAINVGRQGRWTSRLDCKEMDSTWNKAFIETMIEGDQRARLPANSSPTSIITNDFDWSDSRRTNCLQPEMTAKYGKFPYFLPTISIAMRSP